MQRLHPMEAAARLRTGCTYPVLHFAIFTPCPRPFSLSLFLRPTTGFFLHLGSARQSVPGVCTHSAQRSPLGAPTLSHPAVRGQPTSWEQLRRIVLPRSIATVEDLCRRSTILEVILRRWHGSSAWAEMQKKKKRQANASDRTWRKWRDLKGIKEYTSQRER